MINITTRKPAAIKSDKFETCVDTLAKLEKIIHRSLHTHHKKLLPYPPTYYIELHATDVEKDTGTIRLILIKSLDHLKEVEIQYQVIDMKPSFFTKEGTLISRWEEIVEGLLSVVAY